MSIIIWRIIGVVSIISEIIGQKQKKKFQRKLEDFGA